MLCAEVMPGVQDCGCRIVDAGLIAFTAGYHTLLLSCISKLRFEIIQFILFPTIRFLISRLCAEGSAGIRARGAMFAAGAKKYS